MAKSHFLYSYVIVILREKMRLKLFVATTFFMSVFVSLSCNVTKRLFHIQYFILKWCGSIEANMDGRGSIAKLSDNMLKF